MDIIPSKDQATRIEAHVGLMIKDYCGARAAAASSTSHRIRWVGPPLPAPATRPDPTRPDAMGLRDTALLLVVGAAVGWLGPAAHAAPSAHALSAPAPAPAPSPATLREQALLRLQEALGLPPPVLGAASGAGTAGAGPGAGAGRGRRAEAPDFMLQLQRRVAHPDGVLRAGGGGGGGGSGLPHGARIVRSFFEQEPLAEHVLRFNVSRLGAEERVLGAELRVFRLRRTHAPLLLRVYQVEAGRGEDASADEHRLLGVQATGARAPPAWHSFNVAAAVRAWLAGDAPNLGLLVTASALDGGPAARPRARPRAHAHAHASPIARRHRHAPRRQPLLVLYDGEQPAAAAHAPPSPAPGPPVYPPPSENDVDAAYDEDDYEEDAEEEEGEWAEGAGRRGGRGRRAAAWSGPRRRRRRHGANSAASASAAPGANATNASAGGDEGVCARQDLWVEFDEIGWSSWIISPAGYNAFQCVGGCPYPVGPALSPTNHATVQSIAHALGLPGGARPPCCAPDQLDGLSLLYTNDQGDVVLKLYEDMVASTCACH